jgi:hypothetical protein
MQDFNELIFSDPNLADDFKEAFEPAKSLTPQEELLIAAERAWRWNVEFSSKFGAQKEFLETNLMEQFPGVELQKAIKRIKEGKS